jgi:hypothetical protein
VDAATAEVQEAETERDVLFQKLVDQIRVVVERTHKLDRVYNTTAATTIGALADAVDAKLGCGSALSLKRQRCVVDVDVEPVPSQEEHEEQDAAEQPVTKKRRTLTKDDIMRGLKSRLGTQRAEKMKAIAVCYGHLIKDVGHDDDVVVKLLQERATAAREFTKRQFQVYELLSS